MAEHKTPRCLRCGGYEITLPGEQPWNQVTQEWEPSHPFYGAHCGGCGDIRNDEWVMQLSGEELAPKNPPRCPHTMEMFQ